MTSSIYEDVIIVTREEWNALPSNGSLKPLITPQGMYYTIYIETYWCKEDEDCRKIVRDVQKQHMDMGYPDIQFNFLVGADGNVYEGVGWKTEVVDFTRPQLDGLPKFVVGYIGKPNDRRYIRRMARTKDRLFTYGFKHKYLKVGDKFQYNAVV